METIKYAVNNKICTISLNRPDKKNALNGQLILELKSAFKNAENNEDVKVIILSGEGNVFSAGADLQYLQSLQNNTYDQNLGDSRNLMELYEQIYLFPKIVIAKIEGHAIAGGCGLATVCDLAFAVPDAQFGYTEVRIGFVPALVMVFLLRKINERNAKELLLTGKLFDAHTAKNLGLINNVFEKEQIHEKVNSIANVLIENCSSESVRATKQMMAAIPGMHLHDALNYAAEMNAKARETDDFKYGIKSFLEKKKPEWK